MSDERVIQTIQAIKNRSEIQKPYISVLGMLSVNGMSEYRNVCCDRLAEYIDGDHVVFDVFNDCDILLDWIGINRCESVIEGYIDMNKLEVYQEYIYNENAVIKAQNEQIRALYNASTKTIRKMVKNLHKYTAATDEVYEKLRTLLIVELRARRLHNKMMIRIKKFIENMTFYIKNYRTVLIVGKAILRN